MTNTERESIVSVDADLATLRETLGKPWCPNLGSCPPEMHSGCSYCAAHDDAVAALARVEAELSRLREDASALDSRLTAAQDECATLREERDRVGNAAREVVKDALLLKEAAEARCAQLQQALRDSGSLATAIRIGWQDGIPRDAETGLRRIEALAGQPAAAEGPDTPADRKQNVEYWRARSRVAVAECTRLQQALGRIGEALVLGNVAFAKEEVRIALAGPDTPTIPPRPPMQPPSHQREMARLQQVIRDHWSPQQAEAILAGGAFPEGNDGAAGAKGPLCIRCWNELDNGIAVDTPADICPECGSGILNGEHIANYPCSRRGTPADSQEDKT